MPLSAATVETVFNFTGAKGAGQSYTTASDGLGLTVGASLYNPLGSALSGNADLNWLHKGGLGAVSGKPDTPKADGAGLDELMTFVFDRVVKIETITFAAIKKGSSFDFYMDGLFQKKDGASKGYIFASDFTSDSFGVGASDWRSAFRIKSISVSWEDGISAVPLPAGGLLLLTALTALVLLNRKRRVAVVAA